MQRLLPNYPRDAQREEFGGVFRTTKIVAVLQSILLLFLQLCLIANEALNKTEN